MKKTIYLLVLFSMLLSLGINAQEGTKQFMPNSTDRLYLNIGDANFARVGCPERVRLNIYLNAGEIVHFGIQKSGGGNMQIRDASDAVVYGPVAVPTSGNGYIPTYAAAVAGANGTIINGATISGGYDALTYTAATTGSHYFEFTTSGQATYFDATVTDASNNIITNPNNPNASAGRLWSRQWSFTTTSFTEYPVNNDFYVFTGDEFVNRVTFHMKPFVFNFVANSFGAANTGNIIVDRQSITGNAFSSDVSEYRIFINDPDQVAFPSTSLPPPVVQAWFNDVKIYDFDYNRTPQLQNINPGVITVNKNNCADPNVTYFKIVSNISGESTILIDVDGDGFKVGTDDVALLSDISVGDNYIPWDLKDASGNTVADGNYNCIPQLLARGPAHFPVYDVEALNEIESYSVRPFEKFDPTLYWDDAKIVTAGDWGDNNGAMDATTEDQYLINSTTPRIWTYFGNNGGYDNGNTNTFNQWFYAIDLGLASLGFEVVEAGCVNGAAPVISDIYKSGPINTDITFSAADFEDKYADGGGNPINNIKIISLPSNGTLKLSGTPISANDDITYANLSNITFTPSTDWMGETSFEWNAYNGAYYADNDALVHMSVNTDPTISAIPDQNLCVNTSSGPIAFTVDDAAGETDPADITLTATSSNLAVVPISGIVFGGSGQNRTVNVTPTTNKSGSAKVTVFASDGYSTVTSDFWVIVGPSLEVTGTLQVCPGDDLILNADEAGADTYEWIFNSTTVATNQTLTVNNFDDATDAGTYTLVVTKGACSGSADYEVTSHHLVTFTGNVDVCNGGVLELVADEIVANSYAWKKGAATLSTSRDFTIDPVAFADAGVDYSLSVSKDGCTIVSDPFEITVNNCVPPTVDLSVDNTTIPENGGSAILTATLSNSWTFDVDVTLGYTGTASNGVDYSTTGTVITIPAGSLSGSKTVNAFFDGVYEGDETVIADITNVDDGGNGASENGTQQQTITITDNETAPTVTLSASPTTIVENGGTSTLTATLSSETFEDVVVDLTYAGTATGSGTDYNVATSITISAGNTVGTTTITGVDDAVYEGAETIVADIDVVSGGGASEDGVQQVTVNITDDETAPTVTLSASPTSIAENGGTSILTATLSNETYEDVVVDLTYAGTTTGSGTDYNVATSITISAGNTVGTTTITGVDDVIYEGAETIITDIDAVTGGDASEDGTQQATVTITDDETAPTVTLSASPANIAENGGVSTLTATLSTATYEDVVVDLTYAGTATGSGTDYTVAASITITAGNTFGTTNITGVDDAISEGDETVIADIDAVNGGDATEDGSQQATVTINDDDGVLVSLSASPSSIDENGGTSTLTATLNATTFEDVTVNLSYSGTATGSGTDYNVANSITITAGNLTGATDITAVNDAVYEGNETIIVDISTVSGGDASEDGSQQETVTINDDNDIPLVSLSASPTTIDENGGTSTLTVTLSNETYEDVVVDFSYSGTATGSGTDYNVASSITITAGNLSGTTDITSVDDNIYEGNETVITDISAVNGGGATEDGNQQATVTINDDNDLPLVSLSVSPNVIAENGGIANLTATLSNTTFEDVTVDLLFSGTATGSGTDYNVMSSIAITAGTYSNTINITSVDDAISEGDETVITDIDNVTGGGASEDGTQQVTVTIQDDDGPTANDDFYTIDEDGILNDDVSTNDNGLNNTPLTFTITSDVSNGTVVINDDGTFTYTPDNNFNGDDTFTYQVCDASSACASAIVTITVNPVNDPIYANDDNATVNEDGTLNGTTVLVNDGDDDGSTLTINTDPIIDVQNGTLVINSDGTYTYIPDENFYGDDFFVYQVCNDETPQECTTATVIITVNPTNDEPIAIDDFSTTNEGTPVSGNVIPNDSDADGDNLTVNTTLLSDPSNGDVVINSDGTYTYTPDAGFIGNDIFVYEICDDGVPQLCSHAIVTITVTEAGDLYANDDFAEVDEDGTLNGTTVLANDGDSDGSNLTVNTTPVVDVQNGTLVLNDDGTYTYTPNEDFYGDDSFTYEVCNDEDPQECETATVTIVVNPVNDAPNAEDDIVVTSEDNPISGNVLPNDEDEDGDDLIINTTPLDGPDNGEIVINDDGTFTYTPDPGFTGNDTIVYEICDTGIPQQCDSAYIIITVGEAGDLFANDDFAMVNEDGTLNGTTVLVNDGDTDGSTLTVNTTPIVDVQNGTLSLNDDGTYTYTPDANFTGDDTFTYEVCNDEDPQECETAVVTITVLPDNDELYAVDDNATIDEDQILYGTTVLVNDGDDDGSNLLASNIPVDYPNNGSLVINSDGTYTYIPTNDYFGEDNFTYLVYNDETPEENATAVVTITINPVNDAPNAEDDLIVTSEDEPINGNVIPNDEDEDGDDLTVNTTPLSGPDNGEIVINDDGTFTYTPDDGFVGTDTIVYEICDNGTPQECDSAYIIITVVENGYLYANDDFAEVDEDNTLNGTTVLVNDGDSDGSNLTVNTTPIDDVENGTLVLNDDGTFTYTPNEDFNGEDLFIYEVCNDEDPQQCQTATVVITVNPVNDAPNAEDDIIVTEEDTPINGNVLPNDEDEDGDDLIINTTPLDGPENGDIVINDDGTFTYTPDPGFVGNDTIVYEVCDTGIPQQCDTAYIIIFVGNAGELYANDDYESVYEDNILYGGNILDNDGDSDGSEITVNTTPISDVSHGILTLNWNGTFTYSPDPNYFGEDQFTYEISNNETTQEFAQAVVYINVLPVNDPPLAVDDYVNTVVNSSVSDNVLTNDSDLDGDNLIVNTTPVTPPTNGTVNLNNDGSFVYTPNTDFVGTDYFVYQVCDEGTPQLCSQALVFITITEDNTPLVAYDDNATVNEDEVLNGNSVLENDVDDANNTLTVNTTPIVDVTNGTLELFSDGTYIYTPNEDYNGTDLFQYEVVNNENPQENDVASVTITVIPVNDTPIAINDTLSGNAGDDIVGDVSVNDLGLGDNPVVFVVDINPINGTVDFFDNGTFTYTPDDNFTGQDSIIYEVSDLDGETSKATILLDIIPDTEIDITIPEGFSPNDDGYNDYFHIIGLEDYPNNTIIIMNRWGNKLFEAAPYLNDWDGTNQFGVSVGDNKLPEGTYFYILDLGNGQIEKGYIYLKK